MEWVSIPDPETLDAPKALRFIAYLCLGRPEKNGRNRRCDGCVGGNGRVRGLSLLAIIVGAFAAGPVAFLAHGHDGDAHADRAEGYHQAEKQHRDP